MTPQHTTAILLAGGSGSRIQTDIPKQYLMLGDKPVVRHSFDLFLEMDEIDEIVVVCAPAFQHIFAAPSADKPVRFALPGSRRQDSVYHGLLAATPAAGLICVHDGARPFIDKALVLRALAAGRQYGAATVGMPVKFTVKESDSLGFVKTTPDRTYLWEIQTPQVLHRSILMDGFHHAHSQHITVTDDVALAELIGKEVKLIEGTHTNLKITVPMDLAIANHLITSQKPVLCRTTTS